MMLSRQFCCQGMTDSPAVFVLPTSVWQFNASTAICLIAYRFVFAWKQTDWRLRRTWPIAWPYPLTRLATNTTREVISIEYRLETNRPTDTDRNTQTQGDSQYRASMTSKFGSMCHTNIYCGVQWVLSWLMAVVVGSEASGSDGVQRLSS